MTWLPLAILSPMLMIFVHFGDKLMVSSRLSQPLAVLTYMSIVNVFYGLAVWALAGFVLWPLADMLILMLSGATIVWGNVFYFQAIAREEASRIIVLVPMQSLVVLLLSVVFLSEQISVQQLLGFALILLASVAVTAQGASGVPQKLSRSFWLMVIAVCFWGFSSVLADSVLDRFVTDLGTLAISVAQGALGYALGGVVLYLVAAPVRKAFRAHQPLPDWTAMGAAALIEAVFLVRQFVLYGAIALGPVALVSVIGNTQIFFGVLGGVLLTLWLPQIFAEDTSRANLLHKARWALVSFVGILLMG
jgi:drug/metabolite transporter (DMT)-like permease